MSRSSPGGVHSAESRHVNPAWRCAFRPFMVAVRWLAAVLLAFCVAGGAALAVDDGEDAASIRSRLAQFLYERAPGARAVGDFRQTGQSEADSLRSAWEWISGSSGCFVDAALRLGRRTNVPREEVLGRFAAFLDRADPRIEDLGEVISAELGDEAADCLREVAREAGVPDATED